MSVTDNVLHVLAPLREGGLERVVVSLAASRPRGTVHVAASMGEADVPGHPFLARLARIGVPATPISAGARNYLGEYRQLIRVIDQFRPAIVHTHGYRSDVIGGAAARARRVCNVSTVHGFTGGGWRNRTYERVQSFALRSADAVIAVSVPLVRRLVDAGIGSERVHCIPNGFPPDTELLSRSAARRLLGLSDGDLTVGWVGRLSREKGGDVMLDAVAQSAGDWRLSMIGDGPERPSLERQAVDRGVGGRVVFHGEIPDAGALLSAFDAFVLSSRTEGTPIALLEAMRSGIPIVATDVGGVPDVVTSREAILVSTENPAALASAVDSLFHNPEAATVRAEHARSRLREKFDFVKWLEAVEQVYRAVSGRGS